MNGVGPRLSFVNRLRRVKKARAAFAQPTVPIHKHVRAAVALVGTNYRVNQGIRMTKNILAIPNNRNANLKSLGNSIKASLKLNDPLRATNEIKNKALWTASNYAAARLGYKNRANTEGIYRLIKKVFSLKQNMNAAPNSNSRQRLGNELGTTLGKLILSFVRARRGTPVNARGANVGRGALNGILTEILGERMAAAILKIIQKSSSVYSWFQAQPKRPNNWVGNWPPRIQEVN